MKKIREWDYNFDASIALGILYKKETFSFEEGFQGVEMKAIENDFRLKIKTLGSKRTLSANSFILNKLYT